MTHKQFALIFVVWLTVTSLLFCTPVRGAEVGLVKSETTCLRSEVDYATALARIVQLKEMHDKSADESEKLVLRAEVQALFRLGASISKWRVENCRAA